VRPLCYFRRMIPSSLPDQESPLAPGHSAPATPSPPAPALTAETLAQVLSVAPKRRQGMAAGATVLLAWLDDLLSNGLGSAAAQSADTWASAATRLILSLTAALADYAQALGRQPWLRHGPVTLGGVAAQLAAGARADSYDAFSQMLGLLPLGLPESHLAAAREVLSKLKISLRPSSSPYAQNCWQGVPLRQQMTLSLSESAA